jgi:hypothetical protein
MQFPIDFTSSLTESRLDPKNMIQYLIILLRTNVLFRALMLVVDWANTDESIRTVHPTPSRTPTRQSENKLKLILSPFSRRLSSIRLYLIVCLLLHNTHHAAALLFRRRRKIFCDSFKKSFNLRVSFYCFQVSRLSSVCKCFVVIQKVYCK